jgi:hypothetical protein
MRDRRLHRAGEAIAHPTDSRLLEIARHKLVSAAERLGLKLKQTFDREGAGLRRRAMMPTPSITSA